MAVCIAALFPIHLCCIPVVLYSSLFAFIYTSVRARECVSVCMCVSHCWNAIRVSEIFCIVTQLENVVVVVVVVGTIVRENG